MFKRIAILGEIGSGNLGDDLGYLLIKKEIEKNFDFIQIDWVTPSRFSQLDYMGYDMVVLGCGTLLDRAGGHYVTKLYDMQKRGIPTAILGSGLSDDKHIPDTNEGIQIYDKVMQKVKYKYLRGEAPDPMWLLGDQKTEGGHDKIGINMGFAGYTVGSIFDIKAKVEALRSHLALNKQPTKTVTCWGNDNAWIGNPDIEIDCNLESISKLNELKAIVAFRGHLGVVAACCGVIPIAIAYSSKIEKMYEGVGVPVTFLDVDQKDWGNKVEDGLTKGGDFRNAIIEAQQKVQTKIKEFCKEMK
jgi:hypothetical protein